MTLIRPGGSRPPGRVGPAPWTSSPRSTRRGSRSCAGATSSSGSTSSRPPTRTLGKLGELLELHPVALEDTREFRQRPKLDVYENHVLLVFFTAQRTGDEDWPAKPIEIHVYVSGGFVATIRREPCTVLDHLHDALVPEGAKEEEFLVYRILDALTDAYYPVIDALEVQIDALEAAGARPPAARAPGADLPAQAGRPQPAADRRPAERRVPARQRGDPRPGRPLEGLARLPARRRRPPRPGRGRAAAPDRGPDGAHRAPTSTRTPTA